MSREFEVTEGMQKAVARICYPEDAEEIFMALTAHPDFRAQLRAWAAEEMRGLVPQCMAAGGEYRNGFVKCRASVLRNITAWEKANESQ